MIILAGVTLAFALGDNGIITNARWSAFLNEMTSVKENAVLKESDHAMEVFYGTTTEISPFTKYTEINSLPQTLLAEFETLGTSSDNLYLIDKKTGNGKENTYLFDDLNKIVYKIKGINIWGTTIHSIEAGENKGGGSTQVKTAQMEVEFKSGYYEPDLNGFDLENTYVVYYSSDWQTTKELLLKNYIEEGKPKTKKFDDGLIYTFYDYNTNSGNSTWGNVKTYANEQEAWWTWVPRYAYDTANMNKTPAEGESAIKIRFITTDNKYIEDDNGTYKEREMEADTTYLPHPSFTLKNGEEIEKELKGIWMSKYEPSQGTSLVTQTSDAKYYAPDMSGFDSSQTYLMKYDSTGTDITNGEGDLLATVGTTETELEQYNNNTSSGTWYDYDQRIWANVKTTANGQEAWWVWIPRYAYSVQTTGKNMDVIFVDLNGKPMDKTAYPDGLPDGYIVHPAFDPDGNTHLKGIWVSKYEPSQGTSLVTQTVETKVYEPNLVGYNVDTTYIVTYNETGENTVKEYKLREVLESNSTVDENGVLTQGKVDETKITEGIWYDYSKRIWGNIKTTANGQEAWWVWIPRYAYSVQTTGKNMDVIFVDLNGKPMDKTAYPDGLPDGYIVHPAFTLKNGDTIEKELTGIWMSKYEPSGAPTSDELTLGE